MKKNVLITAALLGLSASISAQIVKNDSVSMGPGYANQIYYSFKNGQVGSAPVNNWSIANSSNIQDNNIRANHMTGLRVIGYPNGDNSDWAAFDTAGFKTWPMYWNSIHHHNKGAFMQTAGAFPDFSWGVYNSGTKIVTGDSLYLLAWVNGAGQYTKFLKLSLIKQDYGNLIFKYANVDGSNEVLDTLFHSEAANQNYKFYNFLTGDNVVREPAKTDWDINFTRYYAPVSGQHYPVMGVESNVGLKVAKVFGQTWSQLMASDTVNMVKNNKLAGKFTDSMTAIGSDWKFFDGMKFQIMDKQSYIVRSKDTMHYYLLNFTGFGGSANGKSVFQHVELTNTTAVKSIKGLTVNVFPNPVNDKLYISLDGLTPQDLKVSLSTAQGKNVQASTLRFDGGFSATSLDVSMLPAGVYFLNLGAGSQHSSSKIIIQ